jgi:hypothetical protein
MINEEEYNELYKLRTRIARAELKETIINNSGR